MNKLLAAAIKLYKLGLKDIDLRIAELVARYVRAQAEIDAKVLTSISSGRLGELRYRRLRQLEVSAILNGLDDLVDQRAKRITSDSYKLGTRVARKGLPEEFSGSTVSSIDREALDLLGENLAGRLKDATTTVGRRVDDIFRKEGLRLSAMQIAQERPLRLATEDIVERLNKRGVSAFTDSIGRNWNLDSYAEMAIRTVSQESITEGVQARMLAHDLDIVEINKVNTPCTICKEFDGNTYSLTGKSDFPVLKNPPPFHGNCRHGMFPSPLNWELEQAA